MQHDDALHIREGEYIARLKAAVAVHPSAHAHKTASELFHLCSGTMANLAATARIIANDDAIAGAMIRLANRVQHGAGIAVTNAEAATVRLGAGRARSVAIARLFIERAMRKTIPGFDAQSHWQNAIFRGCIARAIAMNATRNLSCMAFLAGILQDAGMPILAAAYESAHARLRKQAQQDALPLAVLESQELGFNHIHTVIRVLKRWQAPVIITEAVGRHHTRPPMTRTKQDALRLWQIAYFVGALPLGDSEKAQHEAANAQTELHAERRADPMVPRMPRESFGLTIGGERLMEQARQEFEDVAEFFNAFLPAQIDLDAMSRDALRWLREGEFDAIDSSTATTNAPAAAVRPDRITPRETETSPTTRLNEDAYLGAQI